MGSRAPPSRPTSDDGEDVSAPAVRALVERVDDLEGEVDRAGDVRTDLFSMVHDLQQRVEEIEAVVDDKLDADFEDVVDEIRER